MNRDAVIAAADIFVNARRTGTLIEALPPHALPATVADGHEVQDETVKRLGEPVGGWKVAGTVEAEIRRAPVLASRVFESGAKVPSAMMPLRGIEAEIAFRLIKDLPARAEAYSREEVLAAVVGVAAIELIDSRFTDYQTAPVMHKHADFFSNGGLVIGAERSDWQDFDLLTIPVVLTSDDEVLVSAIGGNPFGHPFGPMLALANALRLGPGLSAGQYVTCGSFTGVTFVPPGKRIRAEFKGFGSAEMQFEA